jgi:hypothetical protein
VIATSPAELQATDIAAAVSMLDNQPEEVAMPPVLQDPVNKLRVAV